MLNKQELLKKIQAKNEQETQENPFMQNLTSLEARKIMKKVVAFRVAHPQFFDEN